jgi:putative Holliday junction resolvase
VFICGEIKLLYFSIDNPMKITSVLGFDYGKKRIGIATGQTITSTATPGKTINQIDGNPNWTAIQAEIQQWKPQALIVGMPYHTDGSENKMTAAARQFCYELEKRFKLPVIEVNEALSSQQAEEILSQTIKINKHNKHEIDKMAAAIIVQRWLNLQSPQT